MQRSEINMFISMLEHCKNLARRFEVGDAPLSIMLLFKISIE